MSGMEDTFEIYQKDLYQVEHSVKMGFDAGFRALKNQLIPAIMESTMFTDIEKTQMIEKYTHALLNRTCPDWVHGKSYDKRMK